MKSLLFFTCLLLCIASLDTHAQLSRAHVQQDLTEYVNSQVGTDNWVNYLDQLYISQGRRDSLVAFNQNIDLDIEDHMAFDSLVYMSPVFELDSILYTCLQFTYIISTDYSGFNDIHGVNMQIQSDMERLINVVGEENVTRVGDTMQVKIENNAYYIKDPAFDDWKFMPKEMINTPEYALPKEVIDKL